MNEEIFNKNETDLLDTRELQNTNSVEENSATSKHEEQEEKKLPKKKKKNPVFVFFKVLGFSLAVIVSLLVIWMVFSALDYENPLNAVPSGFSLYARTDSVMNSLNPLLDLQVADKILSQESLGWVREILFKLRSSELRDKLWFKILAPRRIDVALYDSGSFLAVVDMGFLSSATRLLPVLYDWLSIPGLQKSSTDYNLEYFTYSYGETIFYIFLHKNLVVVSSSLSLIEESSTLGDSSLYRDSDLHLLNMPMTQAFRITADSKRILKTFEPENPVLDSFLSQISVAGLSTVSFGITDQHIGFDIEIPATINETENPALLKLFSLPDEVSRSISLLPSSVQYYTLLSLGNLRETIEGVVPILPPSMEVPNMIDSVDSLGARFFGLSLEELLYSWVGDELIAIGLEGKPSPVFALKIANEENRKRVFDKLVSSILITENQSLFLDGVRLPQLQLPWFLDKLLQSFGINIPKPYYLVENDFMFFSESAENLANLSLGMRGSNKLVKSETWKHVSTNLENTSEISLFYNLSRSVPFFLRADNLASDILAQYGVGRLDIKLKNNFLSIKLEAENLANATVLSVPGYPLKTAGSISPVLCKDSKSPTFFWLEDSRKIVSFNPLNSESVTYELPTNAWIAEATYSDGLWALTKDGMVFKLNTQLEVEQGFPLITGVRPTFAPVVTKDGLLFADRNFSVYKVSHLGNVTEYLLDKKLHLLGDIVSSPTSKGNYEAWYCKSFEGEVFLYNNDNLQIGTWPKTINGIAFGSPGIVSRGKSVFVAFVTQSGELYLWDELGNLLREFPVNLQTSFHNNFVGMGSCFYALSDDGRLFKVDPFAEIAKRIVSVNIQNLTGKTSYLIAKDYDEDGTEELFVCGDANILYGFNANLELLSNFPVAGHGIPIFCDLNGDKKTECVITGLDGNIEAWKVL